MSNGILPENETDINVMQVHPVVTLVAFTKEPLQTANIAARRCYSPLNNHELIDSVDELSDPELGLFIGGVMKTGHMSTIEHISFTFAIEGVSRALLAQFTRHRLASYSVQSQRYVDFENGFNYIMPMSVEELGDDAMAEYAAQMCTIHQWYKAWLERGLKPEDARFVFPEASETKMVVTMNARELLHFLSLRCCNRAQWEIKYVADEMLNLVQRECPEIFEKAGPSCVMTGRCPEGKRGCGDMEGMKKEYSARLMLNQLVHDADGEENECI